MFILFKADQGLDLKLVNDKTKKIDNEHHTQKHNEQLEDVTSAMGSVMEDCGGLEGWIHRYGGWINKR